MWLRTSAKIVTANIRSGKLNAIHKISAAAIAKLLYSASALDLATSVCFLDHHEMRLERRKMHAPDVDMQSSSEAQSASQKAFRVYGTLELAGCKTKPNSIVSSSYLRILLTAFQ